MSITELSIRRPVMTTLVTLGILLVGILAFRRLPVSDLPTVDFPTVMVTASLPGASPETMASAVATPLEKQFTTISGLDSMTSASTQGNTSITLQFSLDRNIDAAAQDVQAAIAQTLRQLPPDMPSPPTYSKSNPADQPILFLVLTSPTLPLSTLDNYGQTLLGQRISTVSGVSQVQVYGSQKYAVRIHLDPRALAARGIGIDEVQTAIQNANVNLPTGALDGRYRAFTIETDGQLREADAYRPVVIAYRKGAPVRLEDVGQVEDSVENDRVAAWFSTRDQRQRAIVLAVQRQPGTNTVAVAKAVKELLPTFRGQLPASVSLGVLYDASESIEESVEDVEFTMLLTLGLVILVIFLFLRNVRATVIPSVTLPLSVIGTFAAMYLLGYSLDNLSLMALTLSIGFVVDDAIVMLENIWRHTEQGKTVFQAALDGSREITFTILSMTLSLAAVFIPVLFMGGIVGRLFREFAVTIGVAVLISGVVSLTLTPMMASRFLRPHARHAQGTGPAARPGPILRLYEVTLRWALRRWWLVLIASLGIVYPTVRLAKAIPKGFLPSEDRGRINVTTEAIQGISFASMVEHQAAVDRLLQADPNVDSFMGRAGGGGRFGGSNAGGNFIRLKPRHERELSADQVIQSLRGKLAAVPGMRAYLQNPPPIQIGARMGKGQYQYTLQGSDMDELYAFAKRCEADLAKLPGLVDVGSDLQIANPQLDIDVDRDRAATLKVSVAQIQNALYSAFGPRQISTIYAPDNQYKVMLDLLPEYQANRDSLNFLYVRSATGQLVALGELVRIRQGAGPLAVNHSGQLPSVTLSFNLPPGIALGQAVAAIEQATAGKVPASVTTSFQGTAQAFQRSMKGMGLLLIMTVVVIYIVLGILYESFVHPITILVTPLPFAGLGALWTLVLFRAELSLYAIVGIIMLVGIVKKNGIMMVDFAIAAQREEGKSPQEAMVSACLVRLRPIMMTTMAALMAGLPIALGYGAGAESRRPLGLAVVGGLLLSQFLTLYVTPAFFVLMETLRGATRRRQNGPAEA
jgi:HAE1 family hydrophobic/amphiphilic exporter-1